MSFHPLVYLSSTRSYHLSPPASVCVTELMRRCPAHSDLKCVWNHGSSPMRLAGHLGSADVQLDLALDSIALSFLRSVTCTAAQEDAQAATVGIGPSRGSVRKVQ